MNQDDSSDAPERDEKGRLLPGKRLPSPGRRVGKTPLDQVRRRIQPHADELVDSLLKSAREKGDVRAAEVLLDRYAPKPRPRAELVRVPGLADEKTLQGKADAVVRAVANGEVSPEAGARVLSMMDVYAKAIAHDALEARIKALETGRGRVIDLPTDEELV